MESHGSCRAQKSANPAGVSDIKILTFVGINIF